MAKSKSTISLAMMPVEDIANYLEIVKGFSKKSEKAVDTERVDGIDASQIAIAYRNENNEVEDRETVKNAMNLGGIAADKYLTIGDSEELLEDTHKISTTVTDELKAIRDEMYQMKAELAKQGLLKQTPVYDGMYDAFRKGEIKYIDKSFTKINTMIGASATQIPVTNTSDILIGSYIGAEDESGSTHAAKVINKTSNMLFIEDAMDANIPANNDVFKVAGSYHKGEFVFGKESGQYVSTDTIKAIVKDGKSRGLIQTLGADVKGFATKLTDYYSTYGSFLRKVEFSLAVVGNPGNIRASVWKAKEISDGNEIQYERLAISDSVYPSSCSSALNDVVFELNEPVEIVPGTTYLIALYCGGADANNIWKIGGYTDVYEGQEPLWFTDDTYYFDGDKFTVIPGSTDSYLALHISQTSDADILFSNTGLYSCEQEIKNGFTRARVELKVNREGIFNIASDSSLATSAGSQVRLIGEDICPFFNGDQVVIGNMISTITGDCSSRLIQMKDDMYTPEGADVYRVGYKVLAICKKVIRQVPLEYGPEVIVELPLVAVMPGKEAGKEASSSDRLIFESEIFSADDKILEVYDHIQIQVFWNSKLTAEKIMDNKQFAGKILDIAVATDRSYNKIKE